MAIGIMILVFSQEPNNNTRRRYYFVTPLASSPGGKNKQARTRTKIITNSSSSRREVLVSSSLSVIGILTAATAATIPTTAVVVAGCPAPAQAAIDVSGLRVENPMTTDVFLGGNYYPDDEEDRDGVDGRIARMKYNIELSSSSSSSGTTKTAGFSGLYRSIKVKGVSSTISSSRDDYVELPGMIFQCPGSGDGGGSSRQQQQCITIDFSFVRGPKEVQDYWDEKQNGIRFVLDNKVWSKQ